jgi:hypothetical protein
MEGSGIRELGFLHGSRELVILFTRDSYHAVSNPGKFAGDPQP